MVHAVCGLDIFLASPTPSPASPSQFWASWYGARNFLSMRRRMGLPRCRAPVLNISFTATGIREGTMRLGACRCILGIGWHCIYSM